jgi:hypothetical protein
VDDRNEEGPMRNTWWNWRFEAKDGDKGSDVSPPPSVVAARIARRIGEATGHEEVAAEEVTTTDRVSHAHAHDEADEARQRYLESRPGPHS